MSLSEFHKWVKDVVRSACEEALIVEDFVPDPIFDEREGIPLSLYYKVCHSLLNQFLASVEC